MKLRVFLDSGQSTAHIRYEWTPQRDVGANLLLGPNLYIGDANAAKSSGLFPGLEFLRGSESSSNSRDLAPQLAERHVPNPEKITIPLMAITLGPDEREPVKDPPKFFSPDSLMGMSQASNGRAGPSGLKSDVTVGVFWDPLQKWDDRHSLPSALFEAPNADSGNARNHVALFLPSVPEFVAENAFRARVPFPAPSGKTIKLDSSIFAVMGPVISAARLWLKDVHGMPRNNPPRDFQQELDLSRVAFLKTLSNDETGKWRHAIDWPLAHAPAYAALLWMDAQLASDPESRARSRERMEKAAAAMLRDSGASVLASNANTHVMQWEFPFFYGYLAEAFQKIDSDIRDLIRSQQQDGSWPFQPHNDTEATLGQRGDSVLGSSASNAGVLLRYARITGDPVATEAGKKALVSMERFRVPRGAQSWECPIYEPDLAASAQAIRAYVEGYRATGNLRWLHDAVYWAEAGVPFIYLWSLPNKPAMLGASLPVFGSSNYTLSWLARPVQWTGLMYGYNVLHLAQELTNVRLSNTDSPLPLALGWTPADWRHLAEVITVSAMYQQLLDEQRRGTYPDNITDFEKPSAPFINPEDILLNVFALQGHDPDIYSVRLGRRQGAVTISSGVPIVQASVLASTREVRLELHHSTQDPINVLVSGFRPTNVWVNGRPLPPVANPAGRQSGWWWDMKTARLFLTVEDSLPNSEIRLVN
jgi:hypothetical protein